MNLRKVKAAEEELRKERDERAREIGRTVHKHLEQSIFWTQKLTLDVEREDKDIERKAQELNRKGEKHRRVEGEIMNTLDQKREGDRKLVE